MKFIIKIGNSIKLVPDEITLKSTIKELLKSNSQENIICYELSKKILIRELF